jgi:hypothetical protein
MLMLLAQIMMMGLLSSVTVEPMLQYSWLLMSWSKCSERQGKQHKLTCMFQTLGMGPHSLQQSKRLVLQTLLS